MIKFPVTVHILDKKDFVRAEHNLPGWTPYDEKRWSKDSYSCNCLRGLVFAQASGVEPTDTPCGTGRYRIKVVRNSDGATLYEEKE